MLNAELKSMNSNSDIRDFRLILKCNCVIV